MRNRLTVLVLVVASGCAGSDGPRSQGSTAKAAEPTVGSPTILVWEYGPTRAAEYFQIRAYREKGSGGKLFHGISISSFGEQIISAEDAAAILRFYAKYKDKSKSEAKEVISAAVKMYVKSHWGADLGVSYNLGAKTWAISIGDSPIEANAVFFDTLTAAVKDLEALKKVPFSVEP